MISAFKQHELDHIMKRKEELQDFFSSAIPSGVYHLIRSGVAVVSGATLHDFLRYGKNSSHFLDIYFLDARIDNSAYYNFLTMDSTKPQGLSVKQRADDWDKLIERNQKFSNERDSQNFLSDLGCCATPYLFKIITMNITGYRDRSIPEIKTIFLNLTHHKSMRELRESANIVHNGFKFCTYFTTNKWYISKDAYDYIMYKKDTP